MTAYSKWIGFHADEDNGLTETALLTVPVALCDVDPPTEMNGAMALWRHINPSNYADLLAQRTEAALYGCESPTVVFVPFTTAAPGSNNEVDRLAQEAAILAALPGQLALYAAEDPICVWGNLNGNNYMTAATPSVRNTAWFAFEAQAFAIIEAAGYRWAAADDQGLSSMCQTIVERRAAWAAEGLDPDDCLFLGVHCYVDAGYVPAHRLLAVASLARAGVSTPLRITEGAFGFYGVGNGYADKPWLLDEYEIGNPEGYPAHSLTWTRLLLEEARYREYHFLLFTWEMFIFQGGASSWLNIFAADQNEQPTFVEPPLGSLWFNGYGVANPEDGVAQTRAYALRISNTAGTADDILKATAAAQRIHDGYLFTLGLEDEASLARATLRVGKQRVSTVQVGKQTQQNLKI